MKFTINRDLLLLNLMNVSRALSTKAPMPILTGIKIEARNNCLFLTASNNEISIQSLIKDKRLLQIEEEGIIVVPGSISSRLSVKRIRKILIFQYLKKI